METCEEFDELIMAADADSTLKILGENASWLERKILGNVKVSTRMVAQPSLNRSRV